MTRFIEDVDALPSKRLYQSIIADYNLERSICELIDNALDIWALRGRQNALEINVQMNVERQNINIVDNAGGIERENMRYIVGPGQTQISPEVPTIGFFGVGSKRAVVHLSRRTYISSRYENEPTYRVEINDEWIEDEENWSLPLYEVSEISEGSTQIELIQLRTPLQEEDIPRLKAHLETTYALFIQNPQINIILNEETLSPVFFQNWCFPPDSRPIHIRAPINIPRAEGVTIEVWGGLSSESSPTGGDYGFFFYCNDRLITRGSKHPILGFQKGQIGQPHPKIALTKVVVSLNGPARCMPWNSSKSDLNYNHPILTAIRERLIEIGERYAKMSRGFDWQERFLQYTTGEFIEETVDNFALADTSYLPPTPPIRTSFLQQVNRENRTIGEERPWTIGLYEGIIAVDYLFKKKTIRYKNRMCLILLDSTLEIAFKEYLIYTSGTRIRTDRLRELFQNRNRVHEEMHDLISLEDSMWERIEHYYNLRCSLIHERASASIEDDDIRRYREIVEHVLGELFGLTF